MMIRSMFTSFIILVVFSGMISAQDSNDSTGNSHPAISLAVTVAGDIWHVTTAPLRWRVNDAAQAASFALLNTGFIYWFDEPADDEFGLGSGQRYLQPARELVSLGELYDRIGSQRLALSLSAAMIGSGMLLQDRKLLHTSRLLLESLFIAGTITYWSKRFVGRARPYANEGPRSYTPMRFADSEHKIRAFPSGHATSASSMMTVIAHQYPQWWIKYPAYTVTAAVALQRMEDRQHWFSDVVVGTAIGYWVGSLLTRRYQNKEFKPAYSPYVSQGMLGIQFRF